MAEELLRDAPLRADGFDVLGLHLVEDLQRVVGVALDQREEGPVRGRAVGAGEDEVVGDLGEGDGEVCRCWRGWGGCRPAFSHVLAVDDDGHARRVGCVEARGADDYVNLVLVSFGVDESSGGYPLQLGRVHCRLLAAKRFEIAVAGCWSTATDEKIRWHDFLEELWLCFHLPLHLFCRKVDRGSLGFAAIDNEFEALIEFTFYHFAVCFVLV